MARTVATNHWPRYPAASEYSNESLCYKLETDKPRRDVFGRLSAGREWPPTHSTGANCAARTDLVYGATARDTREKCR